MTIMPDYKRNGKIRKYTLIIMGLISIVHFSIAGLYEHGWIPLKLYSMEWKVALVLMILLMSTPPLLMRNRK